MRDIFQDMACGERSDQETLIAYIRRWEPALGHLTDPNYPDAGREFLERFSAAGCEEIACPKMLKDVPATYIPFDPREERSFIQLIKYNMVPDDYGPRSSTSIFRSRIHDGNHAIAWANAPILHASPFNRDTPLIMDPESFLIACDLVERDTYAKQAWIGSLMAKEFPGYDDLTRRDPLTSAAFARIRARHGGALLPSLVEAAGTVLTATHHCAPTYADHYHGVALAAYEAQIDYLLKAGKPFQFVRIGTQDVEDIGRTYGPNIFRDQPVFLKRPHMTTTNSNSLVRLIDKYGTGAHTPEFGDVIHRVSFLETSKERGLPLKVPAASPPVLVAA